MQPNTISHLRYHFSHTALAKNIHNLIIHSIEDVWRYGHSFTFFGGFATSYNLHGEKFGDIYQS